MTFIHRNQISEVDSNGVLLALYLSSFSLLKYFTTIFSSSSKAILFVCISILLMIKFFVNLFRFKDIRIDGFQVVILMTSLLLFDILFRQNKFTLLYFKDFLIYGVLLYLFTINVSSWVKFCKYAAIIFTITYLIYIGDPLKGYQYFLDYMTYGYYCVLPAFVFASLQAITFKKAGYIPIIILSFLSLLIFSNRGATLTAIIVFSYLYISNISGSKSYLLLFLVLQLFVLAIVFNFDSIIVGLSSFLKSKGLSSYSLNTVLRAMSGSFDMTTGRGEIYRDALQVGEQSITFGHGAGYFQSKFGIFTHNLFLEILVSYGLFGLFATIIGIINLIIHIKKLTNSIFRQMIITLLIIGLFPLMFSMTIFIWSYFWLLIIISIRMARENYRHGFNQEKYSI